MSRSAQDPIRMARALNAIADERMRQEELVLEGRFKATCASLELRPGEKLAVLVEEIGEVARAMLEHAGLVSDKHGRELRKELIQIAAVACAWAESLDVGEP